MSEISIGDRVRLKIGGRDREGTVLARPGSNDSHVVFVAWVDDRGMKCESYVATSNISKVE